MPINAECARARRRSCFAPWYLFNVGPILARSFLNRIVQCLNDRLLPTA